MFVQIAWAQNYQPKDFFPAHPGDVWEYSTEYGSERRVIIRDSIAEEGRYIFMKGASFVSDTTLPAFLIDTSLFVVRNPLATWNWLKRYRYKLDADSGDTWLEFSDSSSQNKAYVRDTYESNILGVITEVKEIDYYAQPPGDTSIISGSFLETDQIAAGFGFIYRYKNEHEWPSYILNGAVIAGDTLGQVTVGLKREPLIHPSTLELRPNYPNPFNPKTTIEFVLNKRTFIELGVYNIRGQKVALLALGSYPPGNYRYTFNGSYLASGEYVYYLKTAERTLIRKMMLIK